MKKYILVFSIMCIFACTYAQNIAINNDGSLANPNAILDVKSSTKGILIPRTSTITRNTIPGSKGLLMYDTTTASFWYHNGVLWSELGSAGVAGWSLSGNAGINPINQFLGTTDNQPLRFRVNNLKIAELHPGSGNILFGLNAGMSSSSGFSNIAIGSGALRSNTTRSNLVALGDSALYNNGLGVAFGTDATSNTAIGSKALFSNSNGYGNTALGALSLYSNTTEEFNTAVGYRALYSTTTGSNTAVGRNALHVSITGTVNTSIGAQSLENNISGSFNTAAGYQSMSANTSGQSNVAYGYRSAFSNSGGHFNTAIGYRAAYGTTLSQYNTNVGYNAGDSYDNGYNNVFVGANTDVNGAGYYNVIAIGQSTVVGGASTALFGNEATGIYGGWANWSNVSDGRFKNNVEEKVVGLDFILKLRPVTYNLKATELYEIRHTKPDHILNDQMRVALANKEKITYTGFIAQEVESAANAAGFDFSGLNKPKNENDQYSLSYSDFVVPLVKAVQEQQQLIIEMKEEITALKQKLSEKK